MAKIKTLEEQRKLCEAWQRSGLTKTEFCLLNNLSQSSFYSWLKKLCTKNDDLVNETAVPKSKLIGKGDKFKFHKIPASIPPAIDDESCCLEIALPNGVNFKIKTPPNKMDKFLAGLLTWK